MKLVTTPPPDGAQRRAPVSRKPTLGDRSFANEPPELAISNHRDNASPGGKATLAFATTRYGANEIVLMSPAGGSVTRIGAGRYGFGPTWSPDGTAVAFVNPYTCDYSDYCTPGTYDAVWVANSDGSNDVRFLTDGNQPAWKPHP